MSDAVQSNPSEVKDSSSNPTGDPQESVKSDPKNTQPDQAEAKTTE